MSDGSDDDIDLELLQAVGHGGASKGGRGGGKASARKPSKSRKRRSSDEESEDSPSEQEDDDDDYEEARGSQKARKGDDGHAGPKSKSSIMPFKKRFDTGGMVSDEEKPRGGGRGGGRGSGRSDDEDRRGGGPSDRDDDNREDDSNRRGEDSGSELSFGSDLYKDDEDRAELEAMNELERESILYERGERRDAYKERKMVRQKLRAKAAKESGKEGDLQKTPSRSRPEKGDRAEKGAPPSPGPTPMSWRRGSLASRTKESALQKLEAAKAKKEQRRQDSSQKRRREEEDEEREEDERGRGREREEEQLKKKGKARGRDRQDSDDDYAMEEDEDYEDRQRDRDRDGDRDRDRDIDRDRDRDRGRDLDRDRDSYRDADRHGDRDKDKDYESDREERRRDKGTDRARETERDRNRDRDRDRDRDYDSDRNERRRDRDGDRDRDRERDRDRDGDIDYDSDREDRRRQRDKGDDRGMGREVEEEDEEDEEDERAKENMASFEDLKKIVVTRSKLAQWCMEPFFEHTMTGCYVRLGIGYNPGGDPVYRVCEVISIDERDPSKQYKFEGRQISKFLDVRWGEHRARWQFSRVSDKPATDQEISQLFREIDRSPGLRRPSKQDIQQKMVDMEEARTFQYTPEVVKRIVEQKRQAAGRPTNFTFEKERLRMEIAVAEAAGDTVKAEQLQEELLRVERMEEEKLHALQKSTATELLSRMNKKNQTENFKTSMSMGKGVSADTKAAEDSMDPFSRKWTRSQNYYKAPAEKGKGKEGKRGAKGGKEGQMVVSGPAAVQAGEAMGSMRSSLMLDFDVHIDLGVLERWGGANGWPEAFIARKQWQERAYGAPTACRDGRRHTQTLSITDYKKRRGLL